MTLSFKHEYYAGFLNRLVDRLSFILRIKVAFFGFATLKRQNRLKVPNLTPAFMCKARASSAIK